MDGYPPPSGGRPIFCRLPPLWLLPTTPGSPPRHLKVRVIEAIDDVPAQLQKLFALQQDAVEEAEGKEELLVLGRLRAAGELGLCDELVQALHVGLQALPQEEKGRRTNNESET